MLDGDQTAGAEQSPRGALHGPDGIQSVRAAPQRGRRVVLGHLRRHRRSHRDVGRVADHEVNRTVEFAERVGEVTRVQHDPSRGVRGALDVPGDVALGPGPRQRIGLHRVHPGPGHLLGDRERDRAGAGAEVGHDGLGHIHLAEPGDGPAGHHLGLRPGHEHAWPHLEFQVAEVRPAGDVLERLPSGTARDLGPEPRVERGIGHRVQLAAPDPVHARSDQLGVGAR
jgi:hypothetical protein